MQTRIPRPISTIVPKLHLLLTQTYKYANMQYYVHMCKKLGGKNAYRGFGKEKFCDDRVGGVFNGLYM